MIYKKITAVIEVHIDTPPMCKSITSFALFIALTFGPALSRLFYAPSPQSIIFSTHPVYTVTNSYMTVDCLLQSGLSAVNLNIKKRHKCESRPGSIYKFEKILIKIIGLW